MLRSFSFLLLFCIPCLLHSQEPTDGFFRKLNKNERFDAGAPIFSGIIIPVYTPETDFSFHAAGAVTLKTKRNNSYLCHSVIPVSALVNPQQSLMLNLHPVLYWFDDRVLIDINTDYRNMKDNYWGIGSDKISSVEKGNFTTGYQRKSLLFQSRILFKITSGFYAGFASDIHSFKASNLADLMMEDPEILIYGTDIYSSGLGIVAFYDKRNPINPVVPGMYIEIKGVSFLKELNSDYNYQNIGFDYRHFIPIIRKGSVLGLQAKSSLNFGDVPWTDMPQSGGSTDLRGYYQGQYRDNHMLLFQTEYRHFFYRSETNKLSRHGFVFWLSGGTVFYGIKEIKNIILSTGAGYRYRMQPNVTLRIDVGLGTENAGIYLGLNEAF